MPAIGNTPLIKLERLPGPGSADVYVKYEGANPTGSMKDRMALSMIEGAERRGELAAGGTVVEYTGGSTGSSLAMVCAMKGYGAHFVSSDAFSKEKLQTMQALGARLELIPSENGHITAKLFDLMVARVRELSKRPNTFWTNQFNNADNRSAYHAMAGEIMAVSDEDAVETARKLARIEGIFGGTSSGANVWAALQRARKIGPGKRIVSIVCDSGLKYLNGDLYK